MSGKMVSLCIVLSLLAAVPAHSWISGALLLPVSAGTADSPPYLIVLGVMNGESKSVSLSVQNFGPGSVTLTTVDESNDVISYTAIEQDDSFIRTTPFGVSSEPTFIFEAANGTEVFRQTVKNDLKYTPIAPNQGASLLSLKLTMNDFMVITFGNPMPFDLLATMEHQGDPVDGSGTVIQPSASLTSGWLQQTYLQRLSEGDDFYVSMVPKDESDGTGVVSFMAITNWRPFASAQRARRLRREGKAAVEWAVGMGA